MLAATLKFNFPTWHLKQPGCQSLSRTLSLGVVVSPSLGAIGSPHPAHFGENFLKEKRFNFQGSVAKKGGAFNRRIAGDLSSCSNQLGLCRDNSEKE